MIEVFEFLSKVFSITIAQYTCNIEMLYCWEASNLSALSI